MSALKHICITSGGYIHSYPKQLLPTSKANENLGNKSDRMPIKSMQAKSRIPPEMIKILLRVPSRGKKYGTLKWLIYNNIITARGQNVYKYLLKKIHKIQMQMRTRRGSCPGCHARPGRDSGYQEPRDSPEGRCPRPLSGRPCVSGLARCVEHCRLARHQSRGRRLL